MVVQLRSLFLFILTFKIMASQGGINTCGGIGDRQPLNETECIFATKGLELGEKCCYISAYSSGEKISACVILVKDQDQKIIQEASRKLGNNSTYFCIGNYIKYYSIVYIASFILFILV